MRRLERRDVERQIMVDELAKICKTCARVWVSVACLSVFVVEHCSPKCLETLPQRRVRRWRSTREPREHPRVVIWGVHMMRIWRYFVINRAANVRNFTRQLRMIRHFSRFPAETAF